MTIAQVTVADGDTVVVIQGRDLLVPLVAAAEASVADANAAAGTATAAAAAADASEAAALLHSQTAGGYAAAVEDAVDGLAPGATLPLQATTRAAMQALTGMTAGRQAYLGEAGRQGLFVWFVGDYSALVTADPYQGIFVASSADPTAAAGCWVRAGVQTGGWVQASWFGAVADGAVGTPGASTGTNNTPFINSALAQAWVKRVSMGQGTFALGFTGAVNYISNFWNIIHNDGKILDGYGALFVYLPSISRGYGGAINAPYHVFSGPTTAWGMSFCGIKVDGNYLGSAYAGGPTHGTTESTAARYHNICPKGQNWSVRDTDIRRVWGYAHVEFGQDHIIPPWGKAERCYAEEADTLFESYLSSGSVWNECTGDVGARNIPCEGVYFSGTRLVANGLKIAGAGVIVAGNTGAANVTLNDPHVVTTLDNIALWVGQDGGSAAVCNVNGGRLENSVSGGAAQAVFVATGGTAILSGGTKVVGGAQGACAATGGTIYVPDADVLGRAPTVDATAAALITDGTGNISVGGVSRLTATGPSRVLTLGSNITIGADVISDPASVVDYVGTPQTITTSTHTSVTAIAGGQWYKCERLTGSGLGANDQGCDVRSAATLSGDFIIEIIIPKTPELTFEVGIATNPAAGIYVADQAMGFRVTGEGVVVRTSGGGSVAFGGAAVAGDRLYILRRSGIVYFYEGARSFYADIPLWTETYSSTVGLDAVFWDDLKPVIMRASAL